MSALGIEQAARISGHTARDIREMIESGVLPAKRPSGRWLVDRDDLARAEGWRPAPEDAPAPTGPIGAGPVAPVVELGVTRRVEPERSERSEPSEAQGDGLEPLLARVEAAAIEIADLRGERDELKLALREQVASLKHSLEETMGELDTARARIAELEAKGYANALDERTERKGGAMGAALTPLFRPTS